MADVVFEGRRVLGERRLLVATAQRLCRQHRLAEETARGLLADLFLDRELSAQSRLMTFNGAGSLVNWLRLVVRNRILDVLRARRDLETPLPGDSRGGKAAAHLELRSSSPGPADRLKASEALSGLSEQLVGEVSLLSTVKEAVSLEKRELESLHKIDVAATALDQLVREHQIKKEGFEQEFARQRSDWDEEKRQREQDAKAYEESLKKQRQREVEDYEYKKSLERKKAQDKYEEERHELERDNRDKQEELERSWQQREAALKDREEELARLRKESEEFPDRLRKEIEKARAEAVKATEQGFKHQMALLEKDRAAEKGVAELQIKALTDSLTGQAAQVEALQKQLEEAKRQVQEIAVKAIEGASGARALTHVNEIAMEQAKQRAQKA